MPDVLRPTLRQEQQAETRRRLLAASRKCFTEFGFTAATVERIAEDANTSRGTFYKHFANKTEALMATWKELESPEVSGSLARYDEAADFSEAAAKRLVDELVIFALEHSKMGRTAQQALVIHPELETMWVDQLAAGVEVMPNYSAALGGGVRARAMIVANLVGLERVLYLWAGGGIAIERDDLVTALARHWTAR